MNKTNKLILIYGAAACTFIAGILHLTLVPNVIDRNITTGLLFLIGGLAQIFWILPIIKMWHKSWYYIGMTGTIVFILIWIITRIPNNPINGRGGSINEIGMATEIFQFGFVILSAIIIFKYKDIKNK